MYSDLLAKQGDVEWFLFLRPAGWPVGPAYLARASSWATQTRKRVSVLVLDSVDEACQNQELELGIDVLNVDSFKLLEALSNPHTGRKKVWLRLNPRDVVAMANRRLMKIARRLKSDPKGTPTQLDGPAQKRDAPLLDSAGADADFVFTPTIAMMALRYLFPSSVTCSVIAEDSGDSFLRLAGGSTAARSSGRTDGFSLQVPDEVEAMASGQSIRLRIVARAQPGAESARLAVAYSTNDVGNSGWRWFELRPDWSVYEMLYKVPEMKTGGGDFIGLLPGGTTASGVDIRFLAVFVQPSQAEPNE